MVRTAILTALAVVFFAGCGTATQTNSSPPDNRPFIFPDGYELVTAYAYAYQVTGPFVVYICKRPDGAYQTCQPAFLDEEAR